MGVNNCEANLAPINLRIVTEIKNKFYSTVELRNQKPTKVLRQCILKCIADPDNFLNYIFDEE